jgi:hypothetical protein
MRLNNGWRFDQCVGLQDRDGLTGEVFDANVLTCHERTLNAGENIRVGGRAYHYHGDDNLGNSHFTALEPFPKFELVEMHYKHDLHVVLEIYAMKNGHFYVRPYVQTGATSSDHHTKEGFQFSGEFETREAAIEGGCAASKERIDMLYCSY